MFSPVGLRHTQAVAAAEKPRGSQLREIVEGTLLGYVLKHDL
jgi:hypothetical protein